VGRVLSGDPTSYRRAIRGASGVASVLRRGIGVSRGAPAGVRLKTLVLLRVGKTVRPSSRARRLPADSRRP